MSSPKYNEEKIDEEMLDHARKAIELIGWNNWYKPTTTRGVPWGKKNCNREKEKNTSQLSPFLSVGSLSVKAFWNFIDTDNAEMGTAKDQLMWRETFNATAIAADKLSDTRAIHFWNDDIESDFLDHKAIQYDWKNNRDIIMKWQDGDIEGDAGIAMKLLYTNGWIHHLQRHLVADTLTRGKLGQMWTNGMYWFRYTLLDHDAAVNRANWMWLSAVAFSSKQKVYHYGNDYISKDTPGRFVGRNDAC